MDDSVHSAAERLQEALRRSPAVRDSGVRQLWVTKVGDGFIVKQVHADGRVTQANVRVYDWERQLEENESAFVTGVASELPKLYPSQLQPEKEKVDLQYLFLRVTDDLSHLVASSDDYDMLRIAGILRLLLLDEVPLVHQVNREFRLKLRFRVGVHLPPNEPDPQTGPFRRVQRGLLFRYVGLHFDPNENADIPATEFALDGFLGIHVLWLTDHDFSVREFIKHMAHVRGIMHAGKPEGEKDTRLAFWRTMARVGGIEPGLLTLRAIGRVTLNALMPLRESCIAAKPNLPPATT